MLLLCRVIRFFERDFRLLQYVRGCCSIIHIDESKHIQQHLANERTFIAWIRTIISILGVGFVTTTLHFELTGGRHPQADMLIKVIGMVTLLLSFISTIFSVRNYLKKRTGINTNSFHSTSQFAVFLSLSLVVILIVMATYLVFVY